MDLGQDLRFPIRLPRKAPGFTATAVDERRGAIAAFTGLAIYKEGTAIVGEPGSTEREQVARGSPDFFATLGRAPVMGRAFGEEETASQECQEGLDG